jgi:hypothetical protein
MRRWKLAVLGVLASVTAGCGSSTSMAGEAGSDAAEPLDAPGRDARTIRDSGSDAIDGGAGDATGSVLDAEPGQDAADADVPDSAECTACAFAGNCCIDLEADGGPDAGPCDSFGEAICYGMTGEEQVAYTMGCMKVLALGSARGIGICGLE